ncbi:DUF4440 domain-containing protein [Cellulosimicrobium arenosum]|uniref:DUF4440 domain-containing protein n=1 Tax=Cellulosimicrobium arenosum TaxID=2708133 RepID=A0A927J1A4_9MICO|nr:DUF4440 domain-containing protein [Cellulosimicrobium arenosum]MBD8079950.1 DUF4440 domain-containing protein [Cellulosimicrobium arenosum]
MSTSERAHAFFDRYARALLDRDAAAIADLYAVPALILFPGQSVAVSDRAQTEQFFGAAFGQYEGVTDTRSDVEVVAEAPHSVWADVTWHHDNGATERFVYQLVETGGVWQIAVLTPLDLVDVA